MNEAKQSLRVQLTAKYNEMWMNGNPPPGPLRAPMFAGAGKAAEMLRRLPAYRQARTLAITAEPALLQVRLNALLDGKTLLAATPGLKKGLVRLSGQQIPMNRRHLDLHGHAMFQAGKPLPLPHARLGQADMLVSTALAIDNDGYTLNDGRGILDVLLALLSELEVLAANAPLVILADAAQQVEKLPHEEWDARANVLITPEGQRRWESSPRSGLAWDKLSSGLARLPVLKAYHGRSRGSF